MNTPSFVDAQTWAKHTYGHTNLKDVRRTQRAVLAATRMAQHPEHSLPNQMETWSDTKAFYRLLDEEDVTFEALMQPHLESTRELVNEYHVVLAVQDTSVLQYNHHPATQGLRRIRHKKSRGMLLQSVLAVLPESREVLGCLAQEPFLRIPAPKGETHYHRRQRTARETGVWVRMVEEIGHVEKGTTLVHVGDRGADFFSFFHACRSQQTHFLVRAAQNRRITEGAEEEEATIFHLRDRAQQWPSQGQQLIEVPCTHSRKTRMAQVEVAFEEVGVLAPIKDGTVADKAPIEPLYAIRVWETGQVPEQEERLEWLLLTSVPTTTLANAWARVQWYRCRWVVEDYHQCLKTGCHIEDRQLRTKERLERLLGFLSPLAVRLLQLRDQERQAPERLAAELVDTSIVKIVAWKTKQDPTTMSMKALWIGIARMGGFLARKSDGEPGWRTLWRGWEALQSLREGFQYAQNESPPPSR